jgi:hypothetical protein
MLAGKVDDKLAAAGINFIYNYTCIAEPVLKKYRYFSLTGRFKMTPAALP